MDITTTLETPRVKRVGTLSRFDQSILDHMRDELPVCQEFIPDVGAAHRWCRRCGWLQKFHGHA